MCCKGCLVVMEDRIISPHGWKENHLDQHLHIVCIVYYFLWCFLFYQKKCALYFKKCTNDWFVRVSLPHRKKKHLKIRRAVSLSLLVYLHVVVSRNIFNWSSGMPNNCSSLVCLRLRQHKQHFEPIFFWEYFSLRMSAVVWLLLTFNFVKIKWKFFKIEIRQGDTYTFRLLY